MCRLFGLTAAPHRVHATFWLLDASDSLARQSRREPDGTGLGTFADDGRPVVEKQPLAAYEDRAFATEAKERRSQTFVAHIRFASTGGLDVGNTHPFEQRGRLFAHNGVLGDLPRLEAELGPYRDLVAGETDSERFFALVTRRIDEHGGDVGAGLTAAVRWAAGNLPVYGTLEDEQVVGVRIPQRPQLRRGRQDHVQCVGGPHGGRHLEHASEAGTVRVRSGHLARQPAVVVASERMDEDPGWSDLRSGELLHADGELRVTRTVVVDEPPRHPITLADLDERAAASQTGK